MTVEIPKETYSIRDAAEILCMPPRDRQKPEGTTRRFWFLVSGF
jgi:hypothetical protein